jgi:hypothetical protein
MRAATLPASINIRSNYNMMVSGASYQSSDDENSEIFIALIHYFFNRSSWQMDLGAVTTTGR